jgi:membrane protease YdiL (CAAX protease family)
VSGGQGVAAPIRAAAALALSLGWAVVFVLAVEQDRLYPMLGTAAAVAVVASLALSSSVRASLRPTIRDVVVGSAIGVVLVVGTHLGYAVLAPHLPGLGADVARLYGVAAVTPARLAVVILIAVAEELLWRGLLLDALQQRRWLRWPVAGLDVPGVLVAAVVYGAAQAGPRSAWLVVAGVGLGVVWGLMGLRSRGLWMPMVAHLVWTLTVLGAWPLRQ